MKAVLTEYCCKLVLGNKWSEVGIELDKYIRSKDYEGGTKFISSLDVSDEIKFKLNKCLLSYKVSC